ncbi:XRE family transcriptional regulator [Actinomadura craniellae]|uniref:XRE family transcriptional regulator n=1 Tax=Actinomadura craniellae TaxID=2231787 RepID=A0A365HBY0_9ACTN|nr:helix-turn-helix transcriptional regulator [Actinomadura craniellae]RAY16615.1 XRE family transcriptional regulator [Actinomadura craniellae]
MATGYGPVVQSALLRNELVRLRRERKLTQEQVARDLEWSPSKLIRIEGGKTSITKSDLQVLLLQYGVTGGEQADRLQELARGAREPAWWNIYRGQIPDIFYAFLGYEAGMSYLRDYQGSVIPGLLQTPEYAEIITSGAVGPVEVGTVVRIRLQRQQEVAQRENPPERTYILDEAVIRRHVGVKRDPGIMPAQLAHLARIAREDDHVTVRVIPFSVGAHPGMREGSFAVLEFEAGLSDVLYQEGGRGPSVMFTGDDPLISDYRDAFEILREESLSPEKSVALIEEAAEAMM